MQYRNTLAREINTDPLQQPDTLVHLEFLERFQRTTYQEPEKALMLAVLRDAVTCLEKYTERRSLRNRRMCEEALEWICRDDPDWLFSFNNICEAVGVDPAYLRRGLIAMSQRSVGPRRRRPLPADIRESRPRQYS